MSILNGNISRSILIPERSPFGEPFNELGAIRERGQIMDTAALINKKTGEFPAFLYMYMLEIDYPKICQISIYLRCSCSIFFIVSCAVFSPERLINLL